MRQGRFEITPELLAQIKEFEVFVNWKIVGKRAASLQEALKLFIGETGGKTYRVRNYLEIRKISLKGCYFKVYYKKDDGKNPGTWNFWQIMTATQKPQKNIGFQKLRTRRFKEMQRGRLRRAKAKGITIP